MRELSGVPAPVNITSIIISDDHCWHVLALETHQQVNYRIAGNFGRVSNLAVWRSGEIIAKLNSADINSPWLRLAGRPLKYIWLHTVPVLQDNCIHSRECDVGDSSLSLSLSGKEFRVANKVRSWGSRLRTTDPTSSVSPRSTRHCREGKDGTVCWQRQPGQGLPQLKIASYRDSVNL